MVYPESWIIILGVVILFPVYMVALSAAVYSGKYWAMHYYMARAASGDDKKTKEEGM